MSPEKKFSAPLRRERRGEDEVAPPPPPPGAALKAPVTVPEGPMPERETEPPPVPSGRAHERPGTPGGVERPKAIDREALRQSLEKGSSREEAPTEKVLERVVREHAESRGIPVQRELSPAIRREINREATVQGLAAGALAALGTLFGPFGSITSFIPGVFGIAAPVLVGVASAAVIRRYIRNEREAEEKVRQSLASSKHVTPETPSESTRDGYVPADDFVDETIVDGRSGLTLAEAVRRGVARPGTVYRTGGFWDVLGLGYHLSDKNFERMKTDAAYRERLSKGKAPF